MIKKTLIGALLFSIGLGCQVGAAFAVETRPIMGTLKNIDTNCEFNNLSRSGGSIDNLCGGEGWIGIKCNLFSIKQPALSLATVKLISTDLCKAESRYFILEDNTITYCVLESDIKACLKGAETNFTVSEDFGGESYYLGSTAVAEG